MQVVRHGSGQAYVVDVSLDAVPVDLVQIISVAGPPLANLSDPSDPLTRLRGALRATVSTAGMFRDDVGFMAGIDESAGTRAIDPSLPGPASDQNPDMPQGTSMEGVLQDALEELSGRIPRSHLK